MHVCLYIQRKLGGVVLNHRSEGSAELTRKNADGFEASNNGRSFCGVWQGGDVSIPWLMSTNGYGFVWNTPSFGSVEITDGSIAWVSNATETLDFWITTTAKVRGRD